MNSNLKNVNTSFEIPLRHELWDRNNNPCINSYRLTISSRLYNLRLNIFLVKSVVSNNARNEIYGA